MNTFQNKFDALEQLIFEEGVKIQAVDFHQELDLMLIILNTTAILRQQISSYPRLNNATTEELISYEILANGAGIHWPLLDEDLSLKGFLQNELRNIVTKNVIAA